MRWVILPPHHHVKYVECSQPSSVETTKRGETVDHPGFSQDTGGVAPGRWAWALGVLVVVRAATVEVARVVGVLVRLVRSRASSSITLFRRARAKDLQKG